jgi:hypothetical protein
VGFQLEYPGTIESQAVVQRPSVISIFTLVRELLTLRNQLDLQDFSFEIHFLPHFPFPFEFIRRDQCVVSS